MLQTVTFIISVCALSIATFTDLRERIVSNKLTYSIIFLGLGIHFAFSILTSEWKWGLFSIIAASGAFGFAFLLYKIGAWAGGDVKLFTGLAALNPLNPFIAGKLGLEIELFQPLNLPLFPLTLFVFSLFSMFPVAVFITLKRSVKKKDIFLRLLRDLIILSILIGAVFFLGNKPFGWGLIVLLSFPIIWFGLKLLLVSRIFLQKRIKITELEEGMIPAEKIIKTEQGIKRVHRNNMKNFINYIKQYKIAGPKQKEKILANNLRAGGVSEEEVNELKKLVKEGKLENHISVKESAPMVPAILVAYIVLNVVGDVLWHATGLKALF